MVFEGLGRRQGIPLQEPPAVSLRFVTQKKEIILQFSQRHFVRVPSRAVLDPSLVVVFFSPFLLPNLAEQTSRLKISSATWPARRPPDLIPTKSPPYREDVVVERKIGSPLFGTYCATIDFPRV